MRSIDNPRKFWHFDVSLNESISRYVYEHYRDFPASPCHPLTPTIKIRPKHSFIHVVWYAMRKRGKLDLFSVIHKHIACARFKKQTRRLRCSQFLNNAHFLWKFPYLCGRRFGDACLLPTLHFHHLKHKSKILEFSSSLFCSCLESRSACDG